MLPSQLINNIMLLIRRLQMYKVDRIGWEGRRRSSRSSNSSTMSIRSMFVSLLTVVALSVLPSTAFQSLTPQKVPPMLTPPIPPALPISSPNRPSCIFIRFHHTNWRAARTVYCNWQKDVSLIGCANFFSRPTHTNLITPPPCPPILLFGRHNEILQFVYKNWTQIMAKSKLFQGNGQQKYIDMHTYICLFLCCSL